ncbi:MAG: TonB-dependent receptor [Paucibacter sp.]|nr:TonB-dependent receptor [Roseateles sp.]
MKFLKTSQIALLVGVACATPALWAAEAAEAADAVDVGKISVEGQGVNNGLIQAEETPKARSSVNRAHLDTLAPTSSPYQAIEMLPGVSTFSQDATGLFGGGLRVRGANSDQMGFTINGAPVNDSGNFAVYPQEYSDQENLCEIFVTQGATDTEAPHVGASGGNVGMTTCRPTDKFGVTFSQSVGQLDFYKTFVRVNSGKLLDNTFKAFISVSKTDANKFKGPGKADKFHIDVGAEYTPTKDLTITSDLLFNRARNNNILTLSPNDVATLGYFADYSTAIPQHTPGVNGTAQVEVPPSAPNSYYQFQANPFKNALWTAKAEYKVNKDLSVSVSPYFWYGFGTGGSQLTTLKEGFAQTPGATSLATAVGGGIGDLNGDGDTKDTVMVYGSSVTATYRPGVTVQTNARIGDHNLMAGIWYERARHRQTAPRQLFGNDGSVASWWQDDASDFIKRANGTSVEGRDQLTISQGSSYFVQDSFYLVPDKLNVTLGLRESELKRNFTNWANEAAPTGNYSSAGYYQVDVSYHKLLPSLGFRYQATPEVSLFGNVAQNFRTPSNFTLQNLAQMGTGTWNNGVWTGFTLRAPQVTPESSTNVDVGLRFVRDDVTLSASIYHIQFNNRIAASYDPLSNTTTDFNVGNSKTDGVEAEAGYRLNSNWSFYASASYTNSQMQDSLICKTIAGGKCTAFYATAGKLFPDTPQLMGGLSANFNMGGFFAKVDGKFTGHVFATMVNDQAVPGYTLWNLSTGYKFGNMFGNLFKDPQIQVNVNNLANTRYMRLNSGSGSSFTYASSYNAATGLPTGPFMYVGAPRFSSVTLRTDF